MPTIDLEFENEDHTIGNLLQKTLNKNPEVVFAGYKMEHPLEKKINLKITTKTAEPTMVLKKTIEKLIGELDELEKTCG